MKILFSLLLGYLLGSASAAAIVAKAHGIDIFKAGSGNAGFTNAWRVLGFKSGLLVLAGDILKGFIAAWIGFTLAGTWGMLLAAAGSILGHSYSIFLHFRGGKGIAVAAGSLLYISPLTFVLCFFTIVVLAFLTRYMSVGSLVASFLCPLFLIIDGKPWSVVAVFAVSAAYVIWLHRSNIARLRRGTENKLSF